MAVSKEYCLTKSPKIAVPVDPKKEPKFSRIPQTPANLTWSFALLDDGGPFGWHQCNSHEKYFEILQKKKSFETMTLADLGRGGSHNVEQWKLCKAARDRLAELKLEDIDELYSLRLSGTNRIWCIKHLNVMRVLWWDPDHQVCPSLKKHT